MASIRFKLAHYILVAAMCSIGQLDVDQNLWSAGYSFYLFGHDIHQWTANGLLQ
jgi:hypothetical protein